MISSSCPSCGAPITFPHAAAPAVVCANCRSSILRTDQDLRAIGTVARLQRDLSPMQLGVRGSYGGRAFSVVGVLRKGRERVRWNEWYLAFEDGQSGWLGEGNGQFQLFPHPPVSVAVSELPVPDQVITTGDLHWIVVESAQSAVLAAEGTLPFAPVQDQEAAYADLRQKGGKGLATLDFVDGAPVLWVGVPVELTALDLEGLRHFTGWADPVLTAFAGPEVTAVRALMCAGCGAALQLRAPGQTVRVICEYCGTSMDADAEGDAALAALVEKVARTVWKPPLPLGSRGTLGGVEWQVIGAMRRYVTEEGEDWHWAEMLLHNPYRGFAWLVEDTQHHWSFVRILAEVPASDGAEAWYRDRAFRRFQAGRALVRTVVGEFTWEVHAGDSAKTADFVSPPHMLSREAAEDEVTWSVGEWQPAEVIQAAFKVSLRAAEGVAPHQPNPFAEAPRIRTWRLRWLTLVAVAAAVLMAALVLPARRELFSGTIDVGPKDSSWVSAPFLVAGIRANLGLTAVAESTPPDITLSLLNTTTGDVADWTIRPRGTQTGTFRLPAGTYVLRSQVQTDPSSTPGSLRVTVVQDPGWRTGPVLLFFFALFAPLAWALDRGAFETRRWANSSES